MRHYKRKDSWTWRHSNRDCSKWAQSKGPEHMVPSMSELWLICAWPQPPEKRDEEAKQNIWRNNGENVFKFNENYKPINLRRLTNPRNEGLDVKKGENFLFSFSFLKDSSEDEIHQWGESSSQGAFPCHELGHSSCRLQSKWFSSLPQSPRKGSWSPFPPKS